jgi:hypothetical protein
LSVALSGTIVDLIGETAIVTGGKTIILTASGDTWVPALGVPTYVAATTKGTTAADAAGGGGGRTGNGTLTCTFPSGYTPLAGHFAVMILYNDQGSGSVPTNWSQVTGSPFGAGTEKLQIFTKLLVGGESDPVTTISGSGTGISHCANMVIYSGVGSVGAIGSPSNGTGTPMTAGAITTTDSNSIVLFCCGRGDNENASAQTFGGSSTGVTERLDGGTATGNDSQVSMADKTFASSGSSSGAGSATTSITDPWVSVQIELKRSAQFDNARQSIINGMDSAQSEATGWDAVVKAGLGVSAVVRTSDTVVTITLTAFASYDITAQETITVTVPAQALAGGSQAVASPTFVVYTGGGVVTLSRADSGVFSASESAAILALLSRAESGVLSATETAYLLVMLSRADSGTLTATELATILVFMTVGDSGVFSAAELAQVIGVLDRSDSGVFSGAELSTITALLVRADQGTITAAESSTLLSILANRVDSGNLTAAEQASISTILSSADSGVLSAEELATVAVILSQSDSGVFTAIEAASVLINVLRGDSGILSGIELASITVLLGRADSGVLSASEFATILIEIPSREVIIIAFQLSKESRRFTIPTENRVFRISNLDRVTRFSIGSDSRTYRVPREFRRFVIIR